MEPIGAIVGMIGSVVDLFTADKKARYDRLPDWMSPKDFQRQDRTADILLIGMIIVLIAIIIAITISMKNGAK